jgi:hypothetical protein
LHIAPIEAILTFSNKLLDNLNRNYRVLHNKGNFNQVLLYYDDQIKKAEMGGACSSIGR